MSVPQDLAMQAQDIGAGMDQAQAEGMQMSTPRGQFTARALNALVGEVNEFLQMFNQSPIAEVEMDMQEFPMELVQMVMAIMTIAEEAGSPVEMDLVDITTDNDVAKLSALFKRLKSDAQFKEFISQAMDPAQEEVAVEEEAEVPVEGGTEEVTDEELFMNRMG